VPPVPASWGGTNLHVEQVPPELYAGGFHNFKADGSTDIAQTIQFANNSTLVFQWNEVYDPIPPTPVGAPIVQGVSTVPAGGDSQFTFNGPAGQVVEIFIDTDNTTAGTPNPDLTFDLFDPNGNEIQFVDTGTTPESLILELPATGTYTVVVDSFTPAQFGDYLYRVQEVTVAEQVLSDYNLLFFSVVSGNFIGALSEQNLFTNRPLEIGSFDAGNLQMVIARANTPSK